MAKELNYLSFKREDQVWWSRIHIKKKSGMQICNPNVEEMEAEGSIGLTGQLV